MSLKKSKPQQIVSPSPKDLKPMRSGGGVSRRIICWGLMTSLVLITVACLLDYQQGKLADHTSRLPHEVQMATKYLVNMASEMPHTMEIWYEGARGKVVVLTGKMYVGDKTVAQLLFGEEVEAVDPTPLDVKADFELEDELEELIDEGNTLDDLKKVEEVDIRLRKEEELRLYEEKKQEMKEEALKIMKEEKEAAMNALLEEKAKLRAKIEAETASRQAKDEVKFETDNDKPSDDSAEAVKVKLAAEAAAAYEKVLEKQKEEMSRLASKFNKKMESNKKDAEETEDQLKFEGNYKEEKKVPKQQASEDAKKPNSSEEIVYEENDAE